MTRTRHDQDQSRRSRDWSVSALRPRLTSLIYLGGRRQAFISDLVILDEASHRRAESNITPVPDRAMRRGQVPGCTMPGYTTPSYTPPVPVTSHSEIERELGRALPPWEGPS